MVEGMIFCRACGASLHSTAPNCPACGAPQAMAAHGGDGVPRSFSNSIALCLQRYVGFSGRAPRAEYWWFLLFTSLTGIVIQILFSQVMASAMVIVSALVNLALFLPSISVGVRRLHDLDRSGWWSWLSLVPIVGWIILLVWGCTRGTHGSNRFGPENGIA